jgi:S1-C subfamily serine protease
VIGDMRAEIFYAQIYLDHDRYVIDSRPSDAIALAMGAQAPIFVSGTVFKASAQTAAVAPPKFASRDGITVQDLTAPIASYFGVAPSSGVLVADLAPSVANTLRRGDIITRIDGRAVTNPAGFKQQGTAAAGTPFDLVILRSGHALNVKFNPGETRLPSASALDH